MRRLFPALLLIALFIGSGSLQAAELAEETVPAGESADIARILKLIDLSMKKSARHSGLARRDQHAKHHGCVRGTFTVEAQLPDELRQGLFAEPGASFAAWVRFSNGQTRVQADALPDSRGMAIKLMGVPGERLPGDEAHTQDFLMHSYPAFFVADVRAIVKFMRITQSPSFGSIYSYLYEIATNDMGDENLREARIALAIGAQKVTSPLAIRYWSGLPYRLGPGQAMKFAVAPCASNAYKAPLGARLHSDFLRRALRAQLAAGPACFDFLVQRQLDPREQPIEDATVIWDETAAPFVKVARLEIPAQSFESEAQQKFCENLSFNPWHGLAAHQPLGGLNRLRRAAVEESSRLRHRLNGVPPSEPNGREKFD